ncbi:MAG: YHYH protein [Myxococcota bacterium]
MSDGLNSPITEVDCTFVDGTQTRCYRIEVAGLPTNHATGPYCPETIDDGPEAGGKWPTDGQLWDVDGAFIMGLATFYDDPGWDNLWDADSRLVNRVFTPEDCERAAQANSGFLNICIDCTIEALGGPVVHEYLLPVVPTMAPEPSAIDNTAPGVSIGGVRISFPANLDAILGDYQIAALDDCGGHTNNADGYHYHESTGCMLEVAQCDGHGSLLGYALDGFAIHSMTDAAGVEPADLDGCRGHTDAQRGYHYHAAGEGENMFIGCLSGVLVEGGDSLAAGGGGGRPGGPGGG